MSALLPSQTTILADLCSDPPTLAEIQLGKPRATIATFLDNCFTFIRSNHHHLKQHQHYVLEFVSASSPNPKLKFSMILEACASKKPVFRLDEKLTVRDSIAGGVRVSDSCQRTLTAQALEVLVHGTYTYTVLCGQVVGEIDAVSPTKQPPVGVVYDRPASEIPSAINDHYRTHVGREKGFKYWHDASKRILISAPETTEKLFQRALYLWLERHIIDKLRLYSEARGIGQDATDVTIVTLAGEHIIEIKWLGKNAANTEYKQERINEGLRQVAIYLNNDARAIRGYVLLYDARTKSEHENKSTFDPAARHQMCDEPIILFLENETPSQAAKVKSFKVAPNKKLRAGRQKTMK